MYFQEEKIDADSVVVICTRNRTSLLRDCLSHLEGMKCRPRTVLIIDSSDEKIRSSTWDFGNINLIVFYSEPGLPLQRNTALEAILTDWPPETIVHFLDDDAFPEPNYFLAAESILRGVKSPFIVGSIDRNLEVSWLAVLGIVLGLKPKPGFIARNGLSTPPNVKSKKVMWTPGHGFSLVPSRTEGFRFNEEIYFYGEDVDASIRFLMFGEIVVSPFSVIEHRQGPRLGTKEQYDEQEVLLRLFLAKRYPQVVSLRSVITSFILEMLILGVAGALSSEARNMASSRSAALRTLIASNICCNPRDRVS